MINNFLVFFSTFEKESFFFTLIGKEFQRFVFKYSEESEYDIWWFELKGPQTDLDLDPD